MRPLVLLACVLAVFTPPVAAQAQTVPIDQHQVLGATSVAAGQPTNRDAAQTIRVPAADAEMALFVSGAGSQVIVLVAGGLGGNHRAWTTVQPKLTKFGRVVSYDRLGSGASTRSKRPRVASNFVEELRQGLKNAGLQPPYLLVGHSYGGLMVRLFASRYPKEVSGLVLVDPVSENFYRRAQVEAPQEFLKEYEKIQAEADASESEALRRDWLGYETSLQQLRAAPAMRGGKIVILSAAETDLPERLRWVWLDEHARWAKNAGATHTYVKSGHSIHQEQPDAVVHAVELVLGTFGERVRR
ncbi:MAG: alpha/beta fold hydrolase [Sphingomonas sp.]|nr:alpha/beta fold hydrolase [Sphingomonas sp.]